MNKQQRKAELSRQKNAFVFYTNKIIFGRNGVYSKGYRADYINYGLNVDVTLDNVILRGLDCDVPSDISVAIPADIEILNEIVSFLRDAISFFRSSPYRDGSIGDEFNLDFDFSRKLTISQGIYGSRYGGAVISKGMRFTISKGYFISLSPILDSRVIDNLVVGKGNIRFPDGVALFAKLLKLIESAKSIVFINTID
tara:strand:+ start:2124 stop:2714 length:591 start_codon:yes stop_codon:yes gene_type:complete